MRTKIIMIIIIYITVCTPGIIVKAWRLINSTMAGYSPLETFFNKVFKYYRIELTNFVRNE